MGKIRIGIIGNGIISESHLTGYQGNPGCEVTALCDINEERLNYIGDKYGIKARYTHIGKMIAEADVDSVDVCLHNNMHAPVSIYAMEQGKHVYCEKPMQVHMPTRLQCMKQCSEPVKSCIYSLAFYIQMKPVQPNG